MSIWDSIKSIFGGGSQEDENNNSGSNNSNNGGEATQGASNDEFL